VVNVSRPPTLFAVDPPVTAAITAAGAQVHEQLLEMGGALP
jgi:hypothetical protein